MFYVDLENEVIVDKQPVEENKAEDDLP